MRASERRAPACAGAHAACPAVRCERRAPARAAARAGRLGRRAAAGVQRAAACVQWAAAGVRQQPASARTTFTRAAWPGRAMTATRLHCGSRARRAGGGVRRGRAIEAGSDWSLGVPLTRRGRMRAGRPRRTQTAPSGLRGPGPRTRSRATATVDSSVSAGFGRAATARRQALDWAACEAAAAAGERRGGSAAWLEGRGLLGTVGGFGKCHPSRTTHPPFSPPPS